MRVYNINNMPLSFKAEISEKSLSAVSKEIRGDLKLKKKLNRSIEKIKEMGDPNTVIGIERESSTFRIYNKQLPSAEERVYYNMHLRGSSYDGATYIGYITKLSKEPEIIPILEKKFLAQRKARLDDALNSLKQLAGESAYLACKKSIEKHDALKRMQENYSAL